MLLSILGGIGGALIAVWGTGALVAAVPGSLPRADEFSVDWHVLAYALVAALATGILLASRSHSKPCERTCNMR